MIHIVIGTKAQLIKMAPVMRCLMDSGIEFNFVSTGQHRDTMQDLLDNFGLRSPDFSLYAGRDITSIPQMIGWSLRILWTAFTRRSEAFRGDKSGIVLVHGDTFSTALGALLAKIARLKVGHVESGLRSFNLVQPFPEELTRLATFALSDLMFCPNATAVRNLSGYHGRAIDTGGNTLFDALALVLRKIREVDDDILPQGPFSLVTLHRFENFRNASSTLKIVEIVERIAMSHRLLFILHKPTELRLKQYGLHERLSLNPNIELRPRYDYLRFVKLLAAARFVVSDGGSNQEECSYLGVPVLLLRNVTERSEGIGRNVVVSRFEWPIIEEFLGNLDHYRFEPMQQTLSPSMAIVEACRPYATPRLDAAAP